MNGCATAPNKDYIPPKDWDALNADEKIERMREIIKSQNSSLSYQGRQINSLNRKLSKHQHVDGKVVEMKEVNMYDDEGCGLVGQNSLSENKFF